VVLKVVVVVFDVIVDLVSIVDFEVLNVVIVSNVVSKVVLVM
tara:strand:- start:364 stop:489 length:126 start_codon:yes stop_codon:yes gene_type:complete